MGGNSNGGVGGGARIRRRQKYDRTTVCFPPKHYF